MLLCSITLNFFSYLEISCNNRASSYNCENDTDGSDTLKNIEIFRFSIHILVGGPDVGNGAFPVIFLVGAKIFTEKNLAG